MPEEKVQQLPLAKVLISERNTRQPKPTDPDVIDLARSIKARGQSTPGIARPHPKKKGCVELAAGARRRVANEVAEKATMDVIVREMDDDEFEELIIVENLQRTDPTPQAEAEVLSRIAARGGRSIAEIAAYMGKPESWVARRMKLLEVVPELRKQWAPDKRFGHFTVDMMEFLGSLPKPVQMDLAKDPYPACHSRSRRELETRLGGQMARLDCVPFKLDDPRFFVKGCGPGCASDSSKEKSLFDFAPESKGKKGKPAECGRCLNTLCFSQRIGLWRGVRYKELCGDGGELPIYSEFRGEMLVGKKTVDPLWDWQFKPETKETPGATKVILVHQNGMGMQIAWVSKKRTSSSGGKTGQPKSANQKRADGIKMLQGKRWLAVHAELHKALASAELKSLTVPLDDLIATFGLPFKVESYSGGPCTDCKSAWAILDAREKGFPVYVPNDHPPRDKKRILSREESLWPAMQKVLRGMIPTPAKVTDAPGFEDIYIRIGKLIQFDTTAAKTAADLSILPPKSWGKVDPHTLKPVK